MPASPSARPPRAVPPKTRPRREPAAEEVLEYLGTVWGVYRELHAASSRMLENFGVSGPQRFALRVIELRPGITAGQLADAVDLHRSTVSGLVKRFEDLGLVTRRNDAGDRRIVSLEITAAGRKLNARAVVTIEATLRELIAERGGAWRRRSRAALEELASALRRAGTGSRSSRLLPSP